MKQPFLKYSALAILLGAHPFVAATAEEATSLSEVFTKSDTKLSFRYRYEYVDEDNSKEDAKASTLKSRITWSSASYNGFSGLLEVDDVSQIGSEQYGTPSNHKGSDYSIVADPDGTDINQAYLKYKSDAFTGTAGRQRILHAGQRFVGGVGWRQNEQTYDSFRLELPIGKVNVDYSYIWDVNRIFGPDTGGSQPRRFDSDSHALYASFSPAEGHKIGVYAYMLDFDNAAALSSQTYGVEYSGAFGPVTVAAAAAAQSDYKDNPVDYDAEYYMLELGTKVKGIGLGVGYELLGSDDGVKSFATPLATLHKFQGWADLFLVTPADGIEDVYVKMTGSVAGVSLAAFYHDFSADEGSADYGEEFDAVASYPINKNLSVELKYAMYDADEFGVDTDKVWFSVNYTF
ncbi:alginate export family protein [Porticoccus sp.]